MQRLLRLQPGKQPPAGVSRALTSGHVQPHAINVRPLTIDRRPFYFPGASRQHSRRKLPIPNQGTLSLPQDQLVINKFGLSHVVLPAHPRSFTSPSRRRTWTWTTTARTPTWTSPITKCVQPPGRRPACTGLSSLTQPNDTPNLTPLGSHRNTHLFARHHGMVSGLSKSHTEFLPRACVLIAC
jgi:hypothetical protein